MSSLAKFLRGLYSPFTEAVHDAWAFILPGNYAKYIYKKNLDKKLNLKDPKDFNEKVQWLKIYSDTSLWTEMADKYRVRNFISQCGLGDTLVKLYGVWEKAEEIDFNLLPDKFVLKTNNSSGKIILVDDKGELNIKETRKLLNKWVRERHGLMSFEPHYWNIERRIIAEELLENNSGVGLSSSLIDYKFWCIHGEPVIIMVLYDRNSMRVGQKGVKEGPHLKAVAYDTVWKPRPEVLAGPLAHSVPVHIPRPKQFDEMIAICKTLSKPFPQVRVDLYEVNGKVYFGELTFTPGGNLSYFSPEFFLQMGEKLDLSAVKRRTKRFIV